MAALCCQRPKPINHMHRRPAVFQNVPPMRQQEELLGRRRATTSPTCSTRIADARFRTALSAGSGMQGTTARARSIQALARVREPRMSRTYVHRSIGSASASFSSELWRNKATKGKTHPTSKHA